MSDDRDDSDTPRDGIRPSDNTPVYGVPLTPFEGLRQDFARLEFRVERAVGEALTEVAALGSQVESELVDLRGKSGNNGKIGTLRSDIASLKASDEKRASRAAGLLAAIGAALGGSAFAVVSSIRESGASEQRLERLERDVSDLSDDLKAFRADFWRIRFNQPVNTPARTE